LGDPELPVKRVIASWGVREPNTWHPIFRAP
jgi:hypothetical protein